MAKRTLSIALALIMILGVFSVISVNAEVKILATRTLKVGQSADVRLTDPNTGAKLNTIWESSNPAIATVTSLGTVTGIKAGSCVVSTWWNGKNYGVKVIVKAAAKKISISKKSATLTVGKTLNLKLKNATASKVKWSTSNKKIATVSKGKVKAKKKGKATITAKYKGKKYKCKVTVKAKPAKKISLSKKSATLTVGKTLKLKLKNAKASKVKWSTSNKKIATVSKGKVKAKKKGKATITAKYRGKKYKCKITVKKKGGMTIAQAYNKVKKFIQKKGDQYGENTYSYTFGTKSNFKYYAMYYGDRKYIAYYAEYNNQGVALYINKTQKAHSAFYEYKSGGGYSKLYYTADFKKAAYKYKTTKLTYKNASNADNNMAVGMLSWAFGDFNSYTKKKTGVTMKQLGFKNWDK